MNKNLERVFEYFYPDKSGVHFYSIIVWQGIAERMEEDSGWKHFSFRMMEARMVVHGSMKLYVFESATSENGNWDYILEYAKDLKETWDKIFESATKVQDARFK